MRKNFAFIYPLTDARVDLDRDGGWRYDHIADLIVSGNAVKNRYSGSDPIDQQYDFDIEEILFEGKDILPVLRVLNALEDIDAACFHHIHHLFLHMGSDYEIPFQMNSATAKVITLPFKRKARNE